MNTTANPYAAPRAHVDDVVAEAGTQPIRFWPPSGRIGRLRLLAYSIASSLLLMVALAIFGGISAAMKSQSLFWIGIVVGYGASIVFTALLTIQRCHDCDWSGWLSVLFIVPFLNLMFFFIPGTKGANRYGAPPPPNTRAVKILASLMLVFFVVGILAAIALPAYQGYVTKARAVQSQGK
jgi:uncharacterized membrane protein YhaH (DUF805 family)